MPLHALRVSVVNKALEFFSSLACRNFVELVMAMRLGVQLEVGVKRIPVHFVYGPFASPTLEAER